MKKETSKDLPKSDKRIALILDPLLEYTQKEEFIRNILQTFPNSEIFTPYCNESNIGKKLGTINTSFLNKVKKPTKWKFFMSFVYSHFRTKDFDVILSLTTEYTDKVRVTDSQKHVHISQTSLDNIEEPNNIDEWITTSNTVKRKIKRKYDRNTSVIYPLVDVKKYSEGKKVNRKENWYLYIGELNQNNGLELAINACIEAKTPLKVIGTGTDGEYFQEMVKKLKAKGLIQFLGNVSDKQKISMLGRCRALIFPFKDCEFSITPIEANASGTAVIAHRSGMVLESISDTNPKTGVFFRKYNEKELVKILKKFDPSDYDSKVCVNHSYEFAPEIFMYKLKTYIEDVIQNK